METAGPSTTLRFGRDDNLFAGITLRVPNIIVIPTGVAQWRDLLFLLDDTSQLPRIYITVSKGGQAMAAASTSIRLDTRLADEAAKILGVKSRTEAIHVALREIVALTRFKKLMKEASGEAVV